jgi:hypothetical protein
MNVTNTTEPRRTARGRWRALHPGVRVATVVVVAVVVVEVGLAMLDAATRGAAPSGPTSSSLSTAPSGLAAYEELLGRFGHPVGAQRGTLAGARLDPSTTLVVLDPGAINRDDLANVARFVRQGGRLVAGGARPEWLLELAPADIPGWTPIGERVRTVALGEGQSFRVETDGTGSWVLRGGRRALTFEPGGGGRAVLLASASALQNRLLANADNAAFALSLAGEPGRRVVFAEGVHGYGSASGIAAIPFRWKVALIGVTLAALLAMVAAGRRLGPPEDAARPMPPPRRAYVEAVAATLARTRRPADALAPLQRVLRADVSRRAGLDEPAPPAAIVDASRGLGWPADEIEAMFVPLDTDARVLAAGRALSRTRDARAGETERARMVNR